MANKASKHRSGPRSVHKFIDTVERYPVAPRAETRGRTEQYLGSWLAKTGRRQELVLASKVIDPGAFPYVRGGPRLDRASALAACEASLQRLQTDYIDLSPVHWPQRPINYFGELGCEADGDTGGVPIAETLTALAELRQQGKIRHIGVSNETPWGVAKYLRLHREQQLPRIVSIQNPYRLVSRSFEIGLAELVQRKAVGLLAYSPLAIGMLSGKYLGGPRPRRVRGWCGSRPFTTATIIGTTTTEQLRRTLESAAAGAAACARGPASSVSRCPVPGPTIALAFKRLRQALRPDA